MTLDEAIKHAEEEAKEQDKLCKRYDDASGYTRSHNEDIRTTNAKKCAECAADHRQLAEWLKDYKRLLEQEPCEDCISRNQVKSDFADWYGYDYEENWFYRHLSNIPPVNPQSKTGHWIDDTNGIYTDNHDTWECSECGHAQILLEGTPKDNDYNYCPNCGAKMEEEE